MAGNIGYVTAFGTTAIVNGTSRLATKYANDGHQVKPRIYTMPNGSVAHYDGTDDAMQTPGTVAQEFIDDAGPTFIETLKGLKGKVDTVFLAKTNGSAWREAEGILISVTDVTPVDGKRDKVWCLATWRIIDDWTIT